MPIVLLDSTPLGLLVDPRNKRDPVQCRAWAAGLINSDIPVLLPAIIDYELRRELIFQGNLDSINQLNSIRQTIPYLPINEEVWGKAAELWAWARKTGQQTAHDENIDVDVILAAQAIILAGATGEYTVIATGNVRHIQRYTDAREWREVTTESCFNPKLVKDAILVSETNQSV